MIRLLILLLLISNLCSSQNYIPYSKEVPLELGHGFFIADPSQPRLPFLNNPTTKDDGQGANTVIDFKLLESKKAFEELFSSDVAFNARFLFRKATASFNIDESQLNSSEFKTIVFIGKTSFGNQSVGSFNLLSEAKQLISEKKFDEFIERYGSHFVQKVSRGVSLYVFVTVKIDNSSTGYNNGLNIGYNGKVIGGEMDVRSFLNQQRGRKNVSIKIVSNGPDNFSELSQNIINATNSTSVDVFDAIKTGISNSLSKYNKENSYITGYFYSPMSLFGVPKDKIQWSDHREQKLVEIKDEYESALDFFSSIDKLKSSCFYINATKKAKDSLNSTLREIQVYSDSLKKAHVRCLDVSRSDVACDVFSPDESIVQRILDALNDVLLVQKTSLASTQLTQDNMVYWSFPSKCYEGQKLNVTFSGQIANQKIYKLYDIYLDLDFMVNDKVVYTYKGQTTGGTSVKFDCKKFPGSNVFGEVKFQIRANKIIMSTLGSITELKSVPIDNMNVDIRVGY